jgi:hypothetical protein
VAPLVVAGVVLWPAVRAGTADSFPLSTYPMFSSSLDATVPVDAVVGRTADGDQVRLSPAVIAGTDEVIQAGAAVRAAIRSGPSSSGELCDEVAARLAGSDDLATVEVRTDVLDAVAWFRGDRAPRSSSVHATCPVP